MISLFYESRLTNFTRYETIESGSPATRARQFRDSRARSLRVGSSRPFLRNLYCSAHTVMVVYRVRQVAPLECRSRSCFLYNHVFSCFWVFFSFFFYKKLVHFENSKRWFYFMFSFFLFHKRNFLFQRSELTLLLVAVNANRNTTTFNI